MRHIFLGSGLLVASAGLSACSTVTPDFRGPSENVHEETLSEQHLINHIQCQLAMAVREAKQLDAANPQVPESLRAKWLDEWGATVTLALSINNKDTFAPGLSFTHPLADAVTVFKSGNVTTPQNRSVGLGFTWSADATRTETIGFFYSFRDILNSPIDATKCKPSEGPYLSSDLKIREFLDRGIDISLQPGVLTRKPGEAPYQTFSYEVKFIVTTTGDLNPAFSLVHLSANQSGTLYEASRIHTDDLTITMGKVETDPATGKTSPSPELDQQHLANLIGQAVTNALSHRQQQ
jgi:hypothetical protein